jgi:hypothetical protein
MKDIWGRNAVIEGWLKRDAKTGRPLVIRHIRNIELLPEADPDRNAYQQARGAIPIEEGGISPEEAIRRIRNVR